MPILCRYDADSDVVMSHGLEPYVASPVSCSSDSSSDGQ